MDTAIVKMEAESEAQHAEITIALICSTVGCSGGLDQCPVRLPNGIGQSRVGALFSLAERNRTVFFFNESARDLRKKNHCCNNAPLVGVSTLLLQ